MFNKKVFAFGLVGCASVLSGCSATMTNTEASQYNNQVNAVMTEYSNVLQCLGNKIDQADTPVIHVHVRDIDDETVPSRFRERRLSKGGAWWFHTAIGKLETDKVVSLVQRPNREERAKDTYVEISGAWTQDDAEIGVNSKNIGFNNLGGGILDRFGWFDREEASVIAGDFVSSVNQRVVHSSAISLAIKESGQDYEMRIDDGSRRLDFGLRSEANEGPMFAQRRIVEAATLVHISHTLNIDYQDCIEAQLEQPATVEFAHHTPSENEETAQ